MNPLEILATLFINPRLEPAVTIYDNSIQILVETPNADDYRWVNVVTNEPAMYRDCEGTVQQAPYFDPPICGKDTTMFYWDDDTSNDLYRHDRYIRNGRAIFIDAPFTHGLQPGQYVGFSTCLWSKSKSRCELIVKWYKNHNNDLFLVE